jgi:transposase
VEKVWEAGRPEQSGCTREGDLFKYKEREGVEVAFDTLKNTLDFDKVYVQSREGVYGYFFIAFNSLLLYFKSMLREAGMLEKVSVEDLLLQLSKVFLVDFTTKGPSPKSRNRSRI